MEGNEIEEPKIITPFKSMPLSTRNLYGSAQKKKIAFFTINLTKGVLRSFNVALIASALRFVVADKVCLKFTTDSCATAKLARGGRTSEGTAAPFI